MKKLLVIGLSIALFSGCKKSDTSNPSSSTTLPASGALTELFSFSGSDGGNPYGDVTYSGGLLFGMTQYGGPNVNQYGNIFSINVNGTGYTDLHDFVNSDGAYPFGDLLVSGGVMYGMTSSGGANNDGVIFAINTNGSGYRILHTFTGSSADGNTPTGNLVLSGNTLYGMTTAGGLYQAGNIFCININGNGFRNLLDFTGGSNGGNPNGTLTFAATGDTLYGMARLGGANGAGLVFAMDTNGTGFRDLYNFGGASGNGATPVGNLTLSNTTLYGMTSAGGASNHGCIFEVSTGGSAYTDLFDFNGSSTGGAPQGSLALWGSTLYGMTQQGGSSGLGIIFSIGTNGSGYSVMFNFNSTFGSMPDGSFITVNNELYGMTSLGGKNTEGMVFSYSL